MTEAIALISGANTLEFRVWEHPTADYGIILDYPAPVPIERAEFGQTITGTVTARGKQYEPRLTWEIGLAMTRAQWDMLRAFEMRQDRARRSFTAMTFTLLDQYHRYVEPSPQTRAKVTGTTVTTLATGDLAYYAQYQVLITGLTYEGVNRWVRCNLRLLEAATIPV